MALKNYKIVEGQTKIFGINFDDLKILGAVVGCIFAIPSILDIFRYNLGPNFYLIGITVALTLFIILSWANKKKYPGFLLSYISYKSQQSRKITVRNARRITPEKIESK